MGVANEQQFPHIRELTVCLSCGGPKRIGLLICWQCHNELSMRFDSGYGPVMDRVIAHAEALCTKRDNERLR